jgi:hypothetical protein
MRGASAHNESLILRTEIGRPGKELLSNEHVQSVKRCISKIFFVINFTIFGFRYVKLRASHRDIYFIFFHRCMVIMVALVRNSPAEIWRP